MGAPQKLGQSSIPPVTEKYLPVPIHTYHEDDVLDQKLYFLYQGNYVFFQDKGHKWLQADSKRLSEFGIKELYLKVETEDEWYKFMEEKMSKLLQEPRMPLEEKAKVVYSTCVSSAESVFQNPKSPETAKRATNFMRHCLDYLNQDPNAFYELFKASTTNMSEHSHGLHVAAYSVRLAKHLGYDSDTELMSLAIGALLHDLGKTKIPRELLDKKGKISDAEMAELRKHAKFGYDIVSQYGGIIPELSRRIILQHHERIDGSGYPKGLIEHEIHIFSQIVGIADAYDSMTSHRPYKTKASPIESVSELLTLDEKKFNKRLIIAFIEMMSRKP